MSNSILERGVRPFDVLVRGENSYVVKEPSRMREHWCLVRDTWAQEMDYSTLCIYSFEELVENFKFRWEDA